MPLSDVSPPLFPEIGSCLAPSSVADGTMSGTITGQVRRMWPTRGLGVRQRAAS